MAVIIVPKVIEPIYELKPLIFLAGPIRGGGDWQRTMAEKLIERNADVQIACPSRWTTEHSLSRYFVRPFSQATIRQLHWERHYMELAGLERRQKGCVLFWLGLENHADPHPGPEPYAMDTRREIGKWTAFKKVSRARMVVGGSENFYGLSVIRDELNDAADGTFPFYTNYYTTMESLADVALKVACY